MRYVLALVLVAISSAVSTAQLTKGQQAIVDLVRSGKKIPHDGAIFIDAGYVGRGDGFQMTQIIDKESALVKINRRDFVMRGMSTEGKADERNYEFSGLIAIVDTEAYGTVVGAKRTLPLIEVVTVPKLKQLMAVARRQARLRTWDKIGEAVFVEFKGGQLKIDVGGKEKAVPSSEVSAADREWIRKTIAAEASEEKAIADLAKVFK